jgi:hypothetical protein
VFHSTSLFTMQLPAKKTPLSKRQIPTLLGLGILIISLVAGVLLFGNGTGVFAPRATPQTTPKNTRVSNVTDRSFTVSFYTDEATAGFVKYGTEQNSLKSRVGDDRDQLSGSVGEYRLHHVTVRGLTPNTAYYYKLGTGSSAEFDNNGAPFTVKTFPTLTETPPLNKTMYGTVAAQSGAPAEGSIVYVAGENVAEMSSLVKSSGSWAIALSNARTPDGSGYAALTDTSVLNVIIQGVDPGQSSIFSTAIADAQPVSDLVLGETPAPKPAAQTAAESGTAQQASGQSLDDILAEIGDEAESSALGEEEASASGVLDLTAVSAAETPTVTAQPVIQGVAAPGVTITIEVHSDAQIVQMLVADQQGEFSLDIAALSKQLEPGEHTVTYSYTDPGNGQKVTKTQTFFVAGTSTQIAQANTSETSFGSGEPFPVTTPTPTPTPTPAAASDSVIVSTASGTYNSGSVENTIALIIGGIFFMFAGAWSWWLAREAGSER